MRIFSRKNFFCITAAVTSLTAAGAEYFYRFPESMLPGEGQRERMLRRSELALFSGNTACAEAILQTLRDENPLLDTGTLPVQLMLAKDQQKEAQSFFLTQARSARITPDSAFAGCMLGELLLDSGNPCAAISCFQQLAEKEKIPASWRAVARRGELLCWIRLGNYGKADALLQKIRLEFPDSGSFFHIPELLNLSSSGRSNLLLERWKTMKDEFEPRPEPLLYQLLMEGAERARERDERQTAQELLAAAYNYTSSDEERKDIFRKLLNIQNENSPERALDTISRFLNFFPDLSDRDDLEMQKGFLYYKLGQFRKAADAFTGLFKNPKVRRQLQVDAAQAAAQAAERSGDFKLSCKMYKEAIRRTRDPERKEDLQFELMKFLLRTKAYTEASALAANLEKDFGQENDELNLLHLQALIAKKDFRKATEIALRLSRSPVKKDAAEGVFQLAWIEEQQGRKDQARKCYLQYLKRFPRESRAPEAFLAAAEIALQTKEFSVAGREFEKFSKEFSGHTKAAGALLTALYAVKAQNTINDEPDDELEKIEHLYGEIAVRFPNTPEHDTAALLTAESFFYARKYAGAVSLLDELRRRSPKSSLLPEVLLLKARCLTEQRKSAEAFKQLMEILEKYPGSPLAADAALDAGRCACRLGDYQQALRCYSRARELGGSGFVKAAALCESADCRMMMKSREETKAALAIYRLIAADSRYPVLQLEAAFKAGTALEQLGQPAEAIRFYEMMLEQVHSNRKYLLTPGVPGWCARATPAALRLVMKVNLPDGAQRAQRIYRLYRSLSIPGSSAELKNYLSAIRTHYGILPAEK